MRYTFATDTELQNEMKKVSKRGFNEGGFSGVCVCVCAMVCMSFRKESPEGLEVYLHALQLLTTIDEGVQYLGKIYAVI